MSAIRVVGIRRTCEMCPAQWEGQTDDNRPIYVRYRWGLLGVSLGPPGGDIRSALAKPLIEIPMGEEFDGAMSYEELKAATEGVIEWPPSEEWDIRFYGGRDEKS